MIVDVLMPKMGESITEGTIVEWKKSVGDMIAKDETLLEISTDKVDSEIPCPTAGKVLEILFDKNETVEVDTIIARIGTEDSDKLDDSTKTKDLNENKTEEPKDEPKQESKEEPKVEVKKDNKIDASNKNINNEQNKFYSPLVKSIAKKEGISTSELDNIKGSGLDGRVNKTDVLNYLNTKETIKVNTPESIGASTEISGNTEFLKDSVEQMDRVRAKIAEHMINSKMYLHMFILQVKLM